MTRSRSDGLALPVRTVENSCWAASTDLTIRARASSSSSSIRFSAAIAISLSARNESAHAHAGDYPREIALVIHVEHVQRHAVVHTQGEGSGIHHTQALLDRLHVSYLRDEGR